jgi:hypothetical protein
MLQSAHAHRSCACYIVNYQHYLCCTQQGTPSVQLDAQGRARPALAALYSWRYKNLGNLPSVSTGTHRMLAHHHLFFDVLAVTSSDVGAMLSQHAKLTGMRIIHECSRHARIRCTHISFRGFKHAAAGVLSHRRASYNM